MCSKAGGIKQKTARRIRTTPPIKKTGKTEGLTGDCANPTPVAGVTRTTTYQYLSPTLDLPTVVASPSVAAGQTKSTTIQYTDASHPNLPTVITQSGFTPAGAAVARSVTLGYNAFGQVNRIDGPRTDVADVTTLEYNECTTGGGCGQLRRVTNALGHVTTYDSYDANGRLLQMTDANGLVTTYSYDPRGRVRFITQTPPAGSPRVTEYRYTAFGKVALAILPDGMTLTYGYDAAQYLTSITDNLGNRIEYRYDLKGNRRAEYTYDPSGTLVRQIDMAYDLRNRLSVVNAAGSVTQQVHDAVGNLIQEVDPKNNPATVHTPDALNRLIQTLDRLGGTTNYSYDTNDRLKQVTAPNNATTGYSYDDLGNLLQETSPDRGTTTYTYDAAGNVTSITDARGITATYSYDALNRVTAVTYPDPSENIAFTYDIGTGCGARIGRLCQVVDSSGTTDFAYDAYGNILTHAKTELGVTYTTRYTYDPQNRVLTLTYPDGRVATYVRDAVGRVASVSMTVNGTPQTLVSNRSYQADGLMLSQTYGNGLNETRQYDLQGRLTNQSLGTADNRVYGYDANGNLTQKQAVTDSAGYGYDALDRLVNEVTSLTTNAYTYDGNGNRLSALLPNGTTQAYSYTPNSNRLIQKGNQVITLDAAGNTLSDRNENRQFSYNQAGRLVQVTRQGVVRGTYTYNYLNQRTRKVKVTNTGVTKTFVYHYDLLGNLIAETKEDGTVIRVYGWVENEPIAQVQYKPNKSLDNLLYLHADRLNTPRLATDPTQTVVWRWESQAFGQGQPDTDPDDDLINTFVRLRMAGQYFDGESGLFYNWHRYYDPKIGRYISADPASISDHVWTAPLPLENFLHNLRRGRSAVLVC